MTDNTCDKCLKSIHTKKFHKVNGYLYCNDCFDKRVAFLKILNAKVKIMQNPRPNPRQIQPIWTTQKLKKAIKFFEVENTQSAKIFFELINKK